MKKLLIFALALLIPTTAIATPEAPDSIAEVTTTDQNPLVTRQISNSLSSNERRVRNASVRVVTPRGHGTGGLIKYRDIHLVLTASHVVDGSLGQTYLISTETEQQWGILVYKDILNDIALLYMPSHFRHAEPMRWRPRSALVEAGQTITYSGYPSWHSL